MIFWSYKTNKINIAVIVHSFPKIVKNILGNLPKNDYPVLNTRLFVSCWLGFILDNSLDSMRDLFKRLNNTGYEADISTFSKANKHRDIKPFIKIYQELNQILNKIKHKKHDNDYIICPIDSTIITLTSKL
jgi:putative transposase